MKLRIVSHQRNSAIEIYRVLLMLGVVVLHEYSYVGMGHNWLPRLFHTCVVGFVFISGYYGVKLSFAKFARLYGVAIFCAAWFTLSAFITTQGGGGIFVAHLRGWWYVNAYIMLMLFAPLINQALSSCSNRRDLLTIVIPVLMLIFGWSFLSIVPKVKDFIPRDGTFGTHNGLTLVGIYIAARSYRLLELENKLPRWGWAVLWVVSGCICACNLGKYNSPFALAFAASSFTLMKQWGESKGYGKYWSWLGNVCVFLGPSMLSVYLLHVGGYIPFMGFGALKTTATFAALREHGFGGYGAIWCVIGIVFVACIGIDLVRRGLLFGLGKISFSRIPKSKSNIW